MFSWRNKKNIDAFWLKEAPSLELCQVIQDLEYKILNVCVPGKGFSNEENFGQFPLQVNGFRDIHESLEAAMAHKEIETISSEATQKSGQEVKMLRVRQLVIIS